MSRKRPRARRTIWLLLILLLLCLLFELNQWLPGAWPGGGGGGFLSAEQPATDEQDPDDAERTRTARADLTAMEPAEDVPSDWPPRTGIVVEVLNAEGEREEGWHMGVGDGGPESKATTDGTVRTTNREVFDDGFRVRGSAGMVRHLFGVARPAARWQVHMPSRSLKRVRLQPRTVVVDVRDEHDQPVRHVAVRAFQGARLEPSHEQHTDANGRASLKRVRGVAQLTVAGKDADGVAWQGSTWTDARHARPITLRVHRAAPLLVTWAKGHRGIATRARVRAHDGRVLVDAPVSAGANDTQVAVPRPAASLVGARVEIDFTRDKEASTYTVARQIPETGPIPLGTLTRRKAAITVRGRDGPIRNAHLTAAYPPADGPREARPLRARATTEGSGVGRLWLPPQGSHRVLVEAPGMTPVVVDLDPDHTAVASVVAGHEQRVTVVAQGGRPVTDATVLLRMSLEGFRIERSARTDAQGHARFPGLPAGPIELHAHAQGFAWATTSTDTDHAEVRLALETGYPLVVAMATPQGFPVRGARIELQPDAAEDLISTKPPVLDPRTQAYESDDRGMLTIPGLLRRPYRARITAPGYRSLDVRRVVPGATTHFVTLVARGGTTRAPK